MPATAAVTIGTGCLTTITGTIGTLSPATYDDTDMYKIQICDFAHFSALVSAPATSGLGDSQLFLFDSAGNGVEMDDDDYLGTAGLLSRLGNQFVTANGIYYIAISGYNKDPMNDDGVPAYIWQNTPFNVVRAPDGAANHHLGSWDTGDTGRNGLYTINLTGTCFAQAPVVPCYANCDGSTTAPVLNVADFTCFLQKYAAQDPYANCDGSTTPPVLNVADFTCFLQKYAAGCP
jgi:hypothetical protein